MSRRRCYQEGSLFKRGTRKKVWVARWWEDAIGPDNQMQRIRRSEVLGSVADIPTKREAQQMLDDLLRKANSGQHQPQAVLTFKCFVQERWKPDLYPTLKFSSKKFYDNMVETHLIPVFGDTQLRLITKDSVQSFLNAKAKGGSSWKTVKHIRTVFGSILEAAVRDELLTSNPVRRTRLPRRGPEKEKAPIATEDVKALIDKLAEPSRSIAALLAMTGLRIGELLAVRWQDVDLVNGFLAVNQTVYEGHFDEPKSKRSKRRIPFGPKSVEILALDSSEGCGPVRVGLFGAKRFPTQSAKSAQSPTQASLQGARIDRSELALVPACPCNLARLVGAPFGTVQALLGHSSSEITRETYIHSVPADARKAVEGVEKLLGTRGSLIGPKWTQVPELAGIGVFAN